MTIANVLGMTGIVGIVAILVVGVLWLVLTIFILCIMEVRVSWRFWARLRSVLIVVRDRRGI